MLAGSSVLLSYPILLSKQSTYWLSLSPLKLPRTAIATWRPRIRAAVAERGEEALLYRLALERSMDHSKLEYDQLQKRSLFHVFGVF